MSIRVTGIKEALSALEDYKDTKTQQLEKATQKATIAVQRGAKKNVGTDTGRLKTSIHRTSNNLNGTVFTNVDYAPFEEFGTGSKVEIPSGLEDYASQFKGQGEGSFDDLLDNIKDWARRNSIPEGAAYPIAREIAQNGRAANPFMFPAWESYRPKYIKEVKEILSKIR